MLASKLVAWRSGSFKVLCALRWELSTWPLTLTWRSWHAWLDISWSNSFQKGRMDFAWNNSGTTIGTCRSGRAPVIASVGTIGGIISHAFVTPGDRHFASTFRWTNLNKLTFIIVTKDRVRASALCPRLRIKVIILAVSPMIAIKILAFVDIAAHLRVLQLWASRSCNLRNLKRSWKWHDCSLHAGNFLKHFNYNLWLGVLFI